MADFSPRGLHLSFFRLDIRPVLEPGLDGILDGLVESIGNVKSVQRFDVEWIDGGSGEDFSEMAELDLLAPMAACN